MSRMDGDKPCARGWKDPDGMRTHYCIQYGEHECFCGICGPTCTPPEEAARFIERERSPR